MRQTLSNQCPIVTHWISYQKQKLGIQKQLYEKLPHLVYVLTLLHMGGGVFKTQVAFDALLDALEVKIDRRYFLTIPKYTYKSV